jgi:hypothetical protein
MKGDSGVGGPVHVIYQDNGGDIYIGGDFVEAGGIIANNIAKLDSNKWSSIGSGVNGPVYFILRDPAGLMMVGGEFDSAGSLEVNNVTRFDDNLTWRNMNNGANMALRSAVMDLGGNWVYAGGDFTHIGRYQVIGGRKHIEHITGWNGRVWGTLDNGVNGNVHAVAISNRGVIHAAGVFDTADNVMAAKNIAKWDGTRWDNLGSGLNGPVYVLLFDTSGNLYAGGNFDTAGDVAAENIAMWDGIAWTAMGTGVNNTVRALVIDSSGALYAGGDFTSAGGISANRIAKWDGSNWTALGSGTDSTVRALEFDNLGNLWVGGSFTMAGGRETEHLAVCRMSGPATNINDAYSFNSKCPGMVVHGNSIQYYVPKNSEVSLEIYGTQGELALSVLNAYLNAGHYSATFDKEYFSNGVYFIRLKTGNLSVSRRIGIIK